MTGGFAPPPSVAAWRHHTARDGFESVFIAKHAAGYQLDGTTTAVEDLQTWVVSYSITTDDRWCTTRARVWARSIDGEASLAIETAGDGTWTVDGVRKPALDGCRDVDLESSACTNSLPVHRLQLGTGQGAEAPAVYVRARTLRVERLEQRYARLDGETRQRYEYNAPAFDFSCELVYDQSGFVLDYPGIATRAR